MRKTNRILSKTSNDVIPHKLARDGSEALPAQQGNGSLRGCRPTTGTLAAVGSFVSPDT